MTEIIFKNIFGTEWDNLPLVFKKHYANHGFSNDNYIAKGKMKIWLSPFMKITSPIMQLSGTLVPKSGENIDAIVKFTSSPNNNNYTLERSFSFPNKEYSFISSLEPIGENKTIEWTKIGIGWQCEFSFKNNKIVLEHNAYCLKIFGKIIKIPLEIFIGKGYAFETALDDNKFAMYMEIRHFLFGKLYSYEGVFEMGENE